MPVKMPTQRDLLNPLLQALHRLGGSGSIDEIYEEVADILQLPEEVLDTPHDPEAAGRTEVEYRLAWARNYLKHYGLLENSERGVWSIIPDKRDVTEVDPQDVDRVVHQLLRERRAGKDTSLGSETEHAEGTEAEVEEAESWKDELHRVLTRRLQPDGFERLVMRLLRESGFIHVEVTGRSGDGGIDGKGIIRMGGVLSFHVVFQCKRYQGTVSAGAIRDFRGAMIGRADKGLFITTGTFTRDAVREATRDGAPPLDLVDGDQLAEMLKRMKLGVKTETVEQVSVEADWFKNI